MRGGELVGSYKRADGLSSLEKKCAAKGTEKAVNEAVEKFKKNQFTVFQGDYVGVNPFDGSDVIQIKE